MNRISHDLSPYAGVRDPIMQAQNTRIIANAYEKLQTTANLGFPWDRGGRSGSSREPDPRSDVAEECGWPIYPNADLYAWLYLTDSIAARVVEFMSKEAWQVSPKITEDSKTEGTPFLDSWEELNNKLRGGEENGFRPDDGHALFADLKQADILSGIGSYGVTVLCLDDGLDPRLPVAGFTESGSRPLELDKEPDPNKARSYAANGNGVVRERYRLTRNADQVKGRELLATHNLPETQARIVAWETNDNSPRRGWPVLYQITEIDPNVMWTGSAPPTTTRDVHWTRVCHFADTLNHACGSKVLANSRLRCVLPEILDGRKISGAGGIAFWRNAVMKVFLESNPSLGGDVLFNKQEAQDDFEQMMNGFQQWMFLRGLHANPVAPMVVDPSPHQKAKIERICIKNGWPTRIFVGSERGNLASTQDETTHSDNVAAHEKDYESPSVCAPTINRLVAVGVVEKWGNKGYNIEWSPVGTQDELKKAQVFQARTTAFAAAAAGGIVGTFMDEKTFMVKEASYTEEEADAALEGAADHVKEEEQQAQKVADAHGMVPTPPDGFQHPTPPPAPPTPIKVKPGEKLVTPPAASVPKSGDSLVNMNPNHDEHGLFSSGDGGGGSSVQQQYPHLAHLLNGVKAAKPVGTRADATKMATEMRAKGIYASVFKDPKGDKGAKWLVVNFANAVAMMLSPADLLDREED